MNNHSDKNIIDKDLNKKLQDASCHFAISKFGDSIVDEDFIKSLINKRKRNNMKRILKSAAVVMLILVTGISSSIWFNADGVYGGKRFINKCINFISPVDVQETVDGDGYMSEIITVSEEKEIEHILDYVQNLKIATYIPEGYNFEKLVVTNSSEITRVEYTYKNDNIPLFIAFQYYDNNPDIMVMGKVYQSDITGKEYYIEEIIETEEYTVIQVEDNYDCVVIGVGDKNTGIKVIESIKEYDK